MQIHGSGSKALPACGDSHLSTSIGTTQEGFPPDLGSVRAFKPDKTPQEGNNIGPAYCP